jgi:hypothetical protein
MPAARAGARRPGRRAGAQAHRFAWLAVMVWYARRQAEMDAAEADAEAAG